MRIISPAVAEQVIRPQHIKKLCVRRPSSKLGQTVSVTAACWATAQGSM
jgi:hypothetical protein